GEHCNVSRGHLGVPPKSSGKVELGEDCAKAKGLLKVIASSPFVPYTMYLHPLSLVPCCDYRDLCTTSRMQEYLELLGFDTHEQHAHTSTHMRIDTQSMVMLTLTSTHMRIDTQSMAMLTLTSTHMRIDTQSMVMLTLTSTHMRIDTQSMAMLTLTSTHMRIDTQSMVMLTLTSTHMRIDTQSMAMLTLTSTHMRIDTQSMVMLTLTSTHMRIDSQSMACGRVLTSSGTGYKIRTGKICSVTFSKTEKQVRHYHIPHLGDRLVGSVWTWGRLIFSVDVRYGSLREELDPKEPSRTFTCRRSQGDVKRASEVASHGNLFH
ncbi:hypothetical protein STEG23_024598, partial [Scotinomys teguina]